MNLEGPNEARPAAGLLVPYSIFASQNQAFLSNVTIVKSRRNLDHELGKPFMALAFFVALPSSRAAELLKQIADIPLPGGTTRFGYQSLEIGPTLP
jgi:hypothetical protein